MQYYSTTVENKQREEDNNEIWKRDWRKEEDEDKMTQPKEIVKQLEKYVIGQEEAKKSFSLCFRNRWRRKQLKSEISDDILSPNLLLIGPTGVGKSELARRMAKLTNSPFIRVEATKYTEVGFKGQDADQMIEDLLQHSIKLVTKSYLDLHRSIIKKSAEERIVNIIANDPNLFLEAVLKWNKLKLDRNKGKNDFDKDKEKESSGENEQENNTLNVQENPFSSLPFTPSSALASASSSTSKGSILISSEVSGRENEQMKGEFHEGNGQRESEDAKKERGEGEGDGDGKEGERMRAEEVEEKREGEGEDEKKEKGEEEGEGKEEVKEESKKKKRKERGVPTSYLDLKDDFKRNVVRIVLRSGLLEEMMIDYEYSPSQSSPPPKKFTVKSKKNEDNKGEGSMMEYSLNLVDVVRSIQAKFGRGGVVIKRKSIADIRRLIHREETDKIKADQLPVIIDQAKKLTEEEGIVFIDEIDKICQSREGSSSKHDASGEGVQRDLLPIIEGSDVTTTHGSLNTKNILFIASGSFYACKPSDMLPELQGRLPVKVELKHLSENDFYRILSEPQFNLLAQQAELLKAENINLSITPSAVQLIAHYTHHLNSLTQNLGARRLNTVIEKVFEDISFNCDEYSNQTVLIDDQLVNEKLKDIIGPQFDHRKYIL